MSKKCLRCEYVRQPTDTAPEYECPNCGVVYAKFEATAKRNAPPPTPANNLQPESPSSPEQKHIADESELASTQPNNITSPKKASSLQGRIGTAIALFCFAWLLTSFIGEYKAAAAAGEDTTLRAEQIFIWIALTGLLAWLLIWNHSNWHPKTIVGYVVWPFLGFSVGYMGINQDKAKLPEIENDRFVSFIKTGNTSEMQRMLDNGFLKRTPYGGFLFSAVHEQQPEAVKLLLKHGVNPNTDGSLCPAVRDNNKSREILLLLLRAGANADLDCRGHSPLWNALHFDFQGAKNDPNSIYNVIKPFVKNDTTESEDRQASLDLKVRDDLPLCANLKKYSEAKGDSFFVTAELMLAARRNGRCRD